MRLANAKTPRACGKSKPGRPSWKNAETAQRCESSGTLAEYVSQHSQTREDIKTWFEAAELDDYASFGGKP